MAVLRDPCRQTRHDYTTAVKRLSPRAAKGSLSCPWPQDLVYLVGDKILENMQLYAAWQDVSHASLIGIIDTVRNRVLEFALQMEKEAPAAGETGTPSVSNERVSQLYQNIIVGDVANLALGGEHVVQGSLVVVEGDWESLAKHLGELGIPLQDVQELKCALAADKGSSGIGASTAGWVAKLLQRASSGVLKVGSAVTTGLVVRAVSKYLGIG
ncbi:MAG: hypothetical protein Q7R41_15495 [Phycisphaerales bacterium]|nr:hypothetical protein [Phycisphaerales bacterium]